VQADRIGHTLDLRHLLSGDIACGNSKHDEWAWHHQFFMRLMHGTAYWQRL